MPNARSAIQMRARYSTKKQQVENTKKTVRMLACTGSESGCTEKNTSTAFARMSRNRKPPASLAAPLPRFVFSSA